MNFISTVLFVSLLLQATFTFASSGPQGITLEGNIVTAANLPEEAASVSFTIQIKSPGVEGCILYQESQLLNMTSSGGVFSLAVGNGARGSSGYESTSTVKSAFNNTTAAVTGLTCASGSSYTPASNDKRLVMLSFDDGSGAQSITQALDVQTVPFAMYADTLQGKTPTDLIQVNTTTKAVSQANLESVFDSNADVAALVALINGTSTLYAQPSGSNAFTGAVSFTTAPTTSAAPTTSTSIVNKTYADGSIAGKAIDSTTLSSINAGTLPAGDVLSWNGANWAASPTSDSSKLPLAGGTMTGAIAMGGNDLTNVGYLTIAGSHYLGLGTYTDTTETALTGTLNASYKGITWYNTTSDQVKYWNGSSVVPLGAAGSGMTALTGDVSASGSGSAIATVNRVNGVTYSASPGANTVPVVTASNTVTYEAVPNAALANSSVTIGATAVSLGSTAANLSGLTSLGLGTDGTTNGILNVANGSSGGASVTVQNPSATSPYNFNLPAVAGTSGYALTSGGGGTNPMTWTAIPPASGSSSVTTVGTVTSGTWNGSTVTIPYGGTGATTASAARTNLSAAASGTNGDITSTTSLSAISSSTGAITLAPTGALNLNPTTSVISSMPYLAPLGSASLPAYGNSTTTNTGLYFPTATSLALTTNGAAAMTVDSSGKIGIGTTTPGMPIDVVDIITDSSTGNQRGIRSIVTASPTTNSTQQFNGVRGATQTTGSANMNDVDGVAGVALHQGSGNVMSVNGVETLAENIGTGTVTNLNGSSNNAFAATGTSTNVNGSYNLAQNIGTGTVNSVTGAYGLATNNDVGTVNSLSGIYGAAYDQGSNAGSVGAEFGGLFYATKYGATSSVSNATAVRAWGSNASASSIPLVVGVDSMVLNQNTGSITNAYGVSIGYQSTGGGSITNYKGLYVAPLPTNPNYYGIYVDGTSQSYFGGNVGVGITAPTAILNLKAGGTAVGSAPLKFTSASAKLSVVEDGAMEYDGTNYYLTIGSSRNSIPLAGGNANYSTASTSAGTASSPSYTFNGDATSGFYDVTPGTIGVAISGGQVANFSSTGITIPTTSTSSSASTGALVVGGGVGIGGALNVATSIKSLGGVLTSTSSSSTTYSSTSSSIATPVGPNVLMSNTSATDSTGAFENFSVTNSSSKPQSAYMGAVATTGSGYVPSIVIGQQTGSGAYAERMRIDPSGNVGIGTTAPIYPLQVNGIVGASSVWANNGGGLTWGGDSYFFGNGSSHELYLGTNGTERMRVSSTGNVGIGTTSPNQPLHIYHATSPGVRVSMPANDIFLASSTTAATFLPFAAANDGNLKSYTGFNIATESAAPLRFGTANAERMQITAAGNVGIGSTSPGAQLQVGQQGASLNTDPSLSATNLGIASFYSGDQILTFGMANAGAGYGQWIQSHNAYGGSFPLLLNPSGGNVGIGTTAPSSLLQVMNVNSSSPTIVASRISNGYKAMSGYLPTGTLSTSNPIWANGLKDGSADYSITSFDNSTEITRMLIQASTGKVGIGTTAPGYMLDVNGTFHTTSAQVDAIASNGTIVGQAWHGGTYASTSSSDIRPETNYTQIAVINPNASDGKMAFIEFAPTNSSSNSQLSYIGSYSVAGASNYTPITVFGQRTGVNSYQERMRIDASGNVGIGTTNPTFKLTVMGNGYFNTGVTSEWGSAGSPSFTTVSGSGFYQPATNSMSLVTNNIDRVRIDGSGNVGVGTTSPQTALQVAGVISPATDNTYTLGNASYRFTSIYATNATVNTSDVREKKDIKTSDFGLDFITKLRPVSYHWKNGIDTDLHYGLIAQETEEVVANLKKEKVADPSNVIVAHDKQTDRYGIKYTELISPIIKSIQEFYSEFKVLVARVTAIERQEAFQKREVVSQITELKTENAVLKQKNAEMESRLERLEKMMSSN